VRAQHRLSAELDARDRRPCELHDALLQAFQGIALQVQGIAKRMPAGGPIAEND